MCWQVLIAIPSFIRPAHWNLRRIGYFLFWNMAKKQKPAIHFFSANALRPNFTIKQIVIQTNLFQTRFSFHLYIPLENYESTKQTHFSKKSCCCYVMQLNDRDYCKYLERVHYWAELYWISRVPRSRSKPSNVNITQAVTQSLTHLIPLKTYKLSLVDFSNEFL